MYLHVAGHLEWVGAKDYGLAVVELGNLGRCMLRLASLQLREGGHVLDKL